MREALHEFWWFGLKQARACVFAGSFFVILFASKHIPLGPIPRYDFILFAAVALQIALVATRIETLDELKVICVFHVIGLALAARRVPPGEFVVPARDHQLHDRGGPQAPERAAQEDRSAGSLSLRVDPVKVPRLCGACASATIFPSHSSQGVFL